MTNAAEETAQAPPEGTGAGLIAFLNWAINKNELVEATASALRTGCIKVLAVEDDPDGVDLRTADLDALVSRFRTRHRLDMKDRTLDAYEQRFKNSVEMYLKRLDGDADWKPSSQRKVRSAVTNGGGQSAKGKQLKPEQKAALEAAAATYAAQQQQNEPIRPGMITYPFPIRPGVKGSISLPEDLTMREAKRIAAFVSTLALEDEPEPAQLRAATHFHEED